MKPIHNSRIILLLLCALLTLTVGCSKPDRSEEAERLSDELTDLGFENPEQALAQVDSAEQAGVFSAASANVVKAYIYWNSGRFQMATFCCEQALADSDIKDNGSDYCSALGMLADYYMGNGEYGKAVELANKMLEYLGSADADKRLTVTMKSRALTMKAECEQNLGYNDKAEHLYQESIDLLMEETAHPQQWQEIEPLFYNLFQASDFFLDSNKPQKALSLIAKGDTALSRLARCKDVPDYIQQLRGNNLTICQAMIYAANGQRDKAEALYLKHRQAEGLVDIDIAAEARYMAMSDRYDEAVRLFQQADSIYIASGKPISFDYVNLRMLPQYDALQKAGHTAEALALSNHIRQLSDSIRLQERRENLEQANEIQQQREEIASRQQLLIVHRIIAASAFLIILLIGYLLWRSHRYNKVLLEKNRRLVAEIEQREREQQQVIEQLEATPEDTLTANQRLYRRICELMKNPDVYTDPDTNQDTLVGLVGTNRTYIYDALRECANQTPTDFINGYRLRHAAHLLATTTDSVSLIAELCGLSRRTFYRLFNETYSMSPADYRKVARK